MPDRDGYMPGVPCWVDTSQPDAAAAVAFYGGLFGWDLEDVMPADADGSYYIARLGGGDVAAIASMPPSAPPKATWNTYIWVDSADESAATARDAGGSVIAEPFDVMSAGRMAVLADPEGAVFCVWQAGEHRGARVVNEPGSLNFNGLNTRDSDSAKEFYRAVFGWEALAVADANQAAERGAELGGQVLAPPFDAPWVRMTVICDPQGATFTASQFAPENKDVARR